MVLKPRLIITRTDMSERGTLSTVRLDGKLFGYGIERPWKNNRRFLSCFPEGLYLFVPHVSPKFGDVFAFVGGTVSLSEIDHVARYGCLAHVANWQRDVQGCIGIGKERRKEDWMVTNSRSAMDDLVEEITEPCVAHVRWHA